MMNTLALTRRQMVALAAGALGAAVLGGAYAFADDAEDEIASEEEVEAAPGSVDADGYVLDLNGDPAIEAGTATSILTVNSVATEMVLMLGGEDAAATLGQGFEYDEGSLNRSMYPGLEDRRTFTRDDCTIENVAAIGPDLVLIDVAETIETLRGADINAAYMSVTSPETIMQAVTLIGAALGGDAVDKASAYCEEYAAAIDEISAASADLADDERPTVLYLRSIDRSCGANSMPDHWITTAGGVNVIAELGLEGSSCEVNIEVVMDADPDIVICESPSTYEEVVGSDALSELAAVKNGAVYTAPLGPVVWSMGSTEALLQLYWAANLINPDVYDYDVDAVTRDYFEQYYGYDLSDEELEQIFSRQQ